MNSFGKRLLAAFLVCLVSACGGGGGGGGGGQPPNALPVASFTASPSSGTAPLTVAFDASASRDTDGTIASYAWNFGDSTTGTGVTASHTYEAVGSYTATLTVTDNRGGTGTTTRTISVTAVQPTTVTVSGRITYDRVPFRACSDGGACKDGTFSDGLDYTNTIEAPARGVVVEIIQTVNKEVVVSTSTDANGVYSLAVPANRNVFVRAKAMSVSTGSSSKPATWDIRVLDNFGGTNSQYAIDGSPFDTTADQTRNLRATSGWSGFAGYVSERAAAPFAILDTLYSAVQFLVAQGDSAAQLGQLDVFWSTENRPTDQWKPSLGWIQTTAYRSVSSSGGATPGIYVLGDANNDIDEYDQHIIAHEFQHFLEDQISRTDTPGGPHSLDERLDMRVAFSEGFSNAFAAMVLNDPVYRDAFGISQQQVFRFNMETGVATQRGWYNETSVHSIIWDLYDGVNDDAVSIGFAPMYQVMRNELRTGVPLTSIFSFVTALKTRLTGAQIVGVDTRVAAENIVAATMDAYATTETNAGVSATYRDLVMPIYTPIVVNGPTVRVCGDTVVGTYNKLGNRRFLRFNVPTARTLDIQVTCPQSDSTCAGTPAPDPDLGLYHGTSVEFAETDTAYTEHLQKAVEAGDYVLEVYEYSHVDPDNTVARRGRTCLSVKITG